MARANPVARKLLAAVVAPLVKEHGGPPKVAGIVGRHRATVTRWVKGDIDWDGLTELASGLRSDIVITFPAHGRASVTTKEAPPPWARELTGELLDEIRENRRAVLEAIQTNLAAELAKYGLEKALDEQPHDEPTHGSGGSTPTGVARP